MALFRTVWVLFCTVWVLFGIARDSWELFGTYLATNSGTILRSSLFYSVFIVDKQVWFEVAYVASLTHSVFVNPFVAPSLYLAPLLPTPPSDSCHWQV